MMKTKIGAFICILHPQEWIKNLFVVIPLLYARDFFNPQSILQIVLTFVFFCLATSTVYIVNDVLDIERDKQHPIKKYRPLPAGELKVREALFVIYFFYALLLIGFFVVPDAMLVIIAYIIINYLYSFYFKRIPVIGIFLIGIGMILRVYAGCRAISVDFSLWVFLTTFSFGLMLGAVKRILDIGYLLHNETRTMNYIALFSATCTSVFYTVFSAAFNLLLLPSVPFVLFGIYRYLYDVNTHKNYDSVISPILKDPLIFIAIVFWFAITLYAQWPS